VTASKIANGTLTNTQISNSAAIAYSKLNLASAIVNGDISSGAAIAYSKLALGGSIVNGDVATGANIAYSKLNLASSIVNSDVATGAAIAYSKLNLTGSVTNSDISNTAAIAYSKLNLTGSITNSDISNTAAIAYSKLNLTGSITNSDISNTAAIAYSKLANLATGQIIVGNGGTATAATLGGDATINASGTLTIANNAITTAKIADGQITTNKLASGAVPTIIGGSSGTTMGNAATNFMGLFTVGSATESVVQVPVQTSGTISNFDVRISAAAGTLPNSWTFTLRKNGASTAIACTISGTTATQCGDAANSVSFSAGDLLTIQIVPNSTPTASIGRWTARLSTP